MKLALAVMLCVSLSVAPDTTPEDPTFVVQEIIEQQIRAFMKDDAATAYALASPPVRERFRTGAGFLEMVKQQYAPVYRPGNFAFGRVKLEQDAVVQEVLISGPDGKDWTVLYQLVRLPDDSWRINGMHLVRAAPGPGI